jgi:AcrR family transcriptional regulator
MARTDTQTRQRILDVALNRFADRGYAGTSVRDLVADARVTQPTLYYYFPSKARLYQSLVDLAHDQRYAVMREAVRRAPGFTEKLTELLAASFEFLQGRRELVRIAFATAFAATDELPREIDYLTKCRRNFEFVHGLIKTGLAQGVLDKRFDSKELAFGLYGQMNFYVIADLLLPGSPLNRQTANRIVELFLAGAGARAQARSLAAVNGARRGNHGRKML